ncbi:MAG: methyltransferase domain-containing protein [Clostridia bacterium]|nr:methyltransferase domain-containing protein [Clostridia bacterium]
MSLKNNLAMAHEFMKKTITKNSITVDMTAGNGHDTLFLAEHSKSVYAFDIQEKALNNTKDLLNKQKLTNVTLIHDGHENIDRYIQEPVDGVMFNLGFLPGYDHKVATNHETTIEAIKKSMLLLSKNGLMSILVYHGQDSGFTEKEKVLEFVSTIDDNQFKVLKLSFENQRNYPPILILIEKK